MLICPAREGTFFLSFFSSFFFHYETLKENIFISLTSLCIVCFLGCDDRLLAVILLNNISEQCSPLFESLTNLPTGTHTPFKTPILHRHNYFHFFFFGNLYSYPSLIHLHYLISVTRLYSFENRESEKERECTIQTQQSSTRKRSHSTNLELCKVDKYITIVRRSHCDGNFGSRKA